ncbi:MAG: hypothetical protein HY691_05000 [Chloroflexi bacterium]|nr:hypothetical protein [Chloroflexota bacterium]
MTRAPLLRLPLVLLGALALVAGLWGGLTRLGWAVPPPQPVLAAAHGPLMVSGFLGTLIGIERAIALGRPWAYLGPLASGLGAVVLIVTPTSPAGPALLSAGSLSLVAVALGLFRRLPALCTAIQALGAAAWLVGNLLLLAGWPLAHVVPWWAGFLVLTIAGERLELSRLLRPAAGRQAVFLGGVALLLAGPALSTLHLDLGTRLSGAGMLVLALWLGRYDIASRTVRTAGAPRFTALSLLAGYVWLAVGGAIGFLAAGAAGGPLYDATVHALFLGFVLSMIFGHAPLVFAAVLGLPRFYHPRFYVHLALLHVTLLLRVAADLAAWAPGRQWGGLLNVVVLLLFAASTALAARQAARAKRSAK